MNPTVSVIIPVYNDPEGLRTTLDSVCEQTAGCEKYEVVVVDNNSTDNTPSVAQEFTEKHSNTKLIFEKDIQSSYAARNRGIEYSTGELIAFVDADMHVDKTYVEDVINFTKSSDISYIGCNVGVYLPKNTIFARYRHWNGFDIQHLVNSRNFSPTCCLIVRRDVFETAGLFEQRMISSGDVEFGKRVHEYGYNQTYTDQIRLYHPARTSLRSILKREFRIGRGKTQFQSLHPSRAEDIKPIFRPSNFVPMFPHTFIKQNQKDLTNRQMISFYFIFCVQKTVKTIGRIYERIISKI